MAYTEAHKRTQAKYRREKATQVVIRLYGTDADMLEWLQYYPTIKKHRGLW